jgi:Transposase DDE domain group 1
LRVQRDGRSFTVEVTADGEGLVSHAGSALLSQVADKTGLTGALSRGLTAMRERRSGHDRGRIVRDLAVMLADGGEALCDLGAIREQAPLFGEVASDATAYRVIERIAREPELLEGLRAARKKGRERAWELGVAPERVTIDLDATLIQSHSEKQGAAGNFKGGFGFHPMLAYFDESSEAAAGMLRSGNAGANTAVDQIAVAEAALEQISTERIESIEVLLRCDSAGASHELLDWAREGGIRFSVGLDLTETVREAILSLPERAWSPALDQDGSERDNGEAAEITELLDLSGWPERSRVIVRRERPHPGAQLSFTDHDGHRFQAILTDQEGDACELERRHRARARVEDQIKDSKDTGLSKLPFRDFEMNTVWLELVLIAHDLLAWTRALLLTGGLARSQPKRLRHRLLHVAARLAFSARTARLRLQASWPWAEELATAFARLTALPAPSG